MGLLNTITFGGWDNKNKVVKYAVRGGLTLGLAFGGGAVAGSIVLLKATAIVVGLAGVGTCVATCCVAGCIGKCRESDDVNDAPYTVAPGGEQDPESGQRSRNASQSQQFSSLFASDSTVYRVEAGDTVTSLNSRRSTDAKPIMTGVTLPNGKNPSVTGGTPGSNGVVVGSRVNPGAHMPAGAAGSAHSNSNPNPNGANPGAVLVQIQSPQRKTSETGSDTTGTPTAKGYSFHSSTGGIGASLGRGSSYVKAGTPAAGDVIAPVAPVAAPARPTLPFPL